MTQQLDVQAVDLSILLGTTYVPVHQYRLSLKRPVLRSTLINGNYAETVLAPLPCELQVAGRFPASQGSSLRQAVRSALNAHSAFDFTLDGMDLDDMTIAEFQIQKDEDARFCVLHIIFGGTYAGEVTGG